MIEYDRSTDPSIRKAYLELTRSVLIKAMIDGDIRFFKNPNNIWLDMLNTLQDANFQGKFFIGVIKNSVMNHSGIKVLKLLDMYGFRDYSMFSSLWERWYNKKLPNMKELKKMMKEN